MNSGKLAKPSRPIATPAVWIAAKKLTQWSARIAPLAARLRSNGDRTSPLRQADDRERRRGDDGPSEHDHDRREVEPAAEQSGESEQQHRRVKRGERVAGESRPVAIALVHRPIVPPRAVNARWPWAIICARFLPPPRPGDAHAAVHAGRQGHRRRPQRARAPASRSRCPTSTACCAASTSTRTSSTRRPKAASASATSCSAGT